MLVSLAFYSTVIGQTKTEIKSLNSATVEFDSGNYAKSIEIAETVINQPDKINNNLFLSKMLDIKASSEISLGQYEAAQKSLAEALQILSNSKAESGQKALVYIHFAWLFRTQRKFAESFGYAKQAVAAAPENRDILAAHYLNTGRILFASGFDVSSVIWLEKAEKILSAGTNSPDKIDTFRFLSLAWASKLNYQKALRYAEKCMSSAEQTSFKYKYRQSLFDVATILSESGQTEKAFSILKKGLNFSVAENDAYQSGKFLTSLLLHSLDIEDTTSAAVYLEKLENNSRNDEFAFEIKLGKAVIAAFRGQSEVSEKMFAELEKSEKPSSYILLYWKIAIAGKDQKWEQFIKLNQKLLDLTVKDNYRDGLPKIHLNFAKAYLRLNKIEESVDHLNKTLAYIEDIRKSENYNLSLGLSETYHDAYRLLAQIKLVNPQESFELADFLKARLLKDRINNEAVKARSDVSPVIRKNLEDISIRFMNDQNLKAEIEKNERVVTNEIPEVNLTKPDLIELSNIAELENKAIISYFFTLDKKLTAFVWEKDKPLRTVYLPVSENEVDDYAKTTAQKIKNLIFFKRDGKELYDKLLKPLKISAKHLIIVPDKSLWKIPFQALSSDGEKYLIEEKLISYAPSVSILVEQLKSPKPNRQTLQAFANSSFENKVLQYVNAEASSIAEVYNSKPIINATVNDFSQVSEKADILHFSMHAKVDSEQPLDSFLGFRKFGSDDGRLTVEELLSIKLKQGSLVFLASCETNNVLSGEGLVSLAWGMLASGASTVISAQWEANDKSTAVFTNSFYTNYKQGNSTAEAMQKAALELIRNKSNNMHEPYYWADFTLNGDFR